MGRLNRNFSSPHRASVVAAAVLVLTAQPLSAQAARQAPDAPPATGTSAPTRAIAERAPVLATEASARVGVARTQRSARTATAAAQPSDNTVKWAIIIGVAVLAALLIVALAD